MNTIVIQAGGRGSRMNNLTTIKQKCLIPIHGKPILFHIFDLYPDKNFILIVDYKKESLKKYIKLFRPNINVTFVDTNNKGTCAGINKCFSFIDGPFLLLWSDLILTSKINLDNFNTDSINIGTTNTDCHFPCRWKMINNKLIEQDCEYNGVAGFFIIPNTKIIEDIPDEGPFTDYLVKNNKPLSQLYLRNIIDIGTEEQYKKYETNTRFFNEISMQNNIVIKKSKLKKYEHLIQNEIFWYETIKNLNFDRIPKILSKDPFTMEKLHGVNPFLREPSKELLLDIISQIKKIHSYNTIDSDLDELKLVYNDKTFERVYSVSQIIPFFEDEFITINSKKLKNPFHNKNISLLKEKINELYQSPKFTLIHGDTTFSNILSTNNKAYFIDPRGYFGNKKLFGDPRYDFAKLYYSLYGNYDNINFKNYFIDIKENSVFFDIKDSGWSELEDYFFENIPYSKQEIKTIHMLIWFSLCGYVIEDYSSILVSFYNGILLFNEL